MGAKREVNEEIEAARTTTNNHIVYIDHIRYKTKQGEEI